MLISFKIRRMSFNKQKKKNYYEIQFINFSCFNVYIYIYIYIFVEHNRHFLSSYFFVDPFIFNFQTSANVVKFL